MNANDLTASAIDVLLSLQKLEYRRRVVLLPRLDRETNMPKVEICILDLLPENSYRESINLRRKLNQIDGFACEEGYKWWTVWGYREGEQTRSVEARDDVLARHIPNVADASLTSSECPDMTMPVEWCKPSIPEIVDAHAPVAA